MKCCSCNKDIKGGFGFGEKPYTKFRCANCVIEDTSRESMVNGFDMIIKVCEKVVFTSGPKGYKTRYYALLEKLETIKLTAEYFRDKEG